MDVLHRSVPAGHALRVSGAASPKTSLPRSILWGLPTCPSRHRMSPAFPWWPKTGARKLFPSPSSLHLCKHPVPSPIDTTMSISAPDWLCIPPLTEPVPYLTFPLWAHVNLLGPWGFISLCPTGSLWCVEGPPVAVLMWAGLMLLHRHLEVPSTRVLRTLGLLQNSEVASRSSESDSGSFVIPLFLVAPPGCWPHVPTVTS